MQYLFIFFILTLLFSVFLVFSHLVESFDLPSYSIISFLFLVPFSDISVASFTCGLFFKTFLFLAVRCLSPDYPSKHNMYDVILYVPSWQMLNEPSWQARQLSRRWRKVLYWSVSDCHRRYMLHSLSVLLTVTLAVVSVLCPACLWLFPCTTFIYLYRHV